MRTALIVRMRSGDRQLPEYTAQLAKRDDFTAVVVCQDGEYNGVGDDANIIALPDEAGEGAAMKRAYKYVMENLPDCDMVIRVSADDEYTANDILRVQRLLRKNRSALVIGLRSRNHSLGWAGKLRRSIVNQVFAVASGRNLRDVETGLRGFYREYIPSLLKVDGERYEYEVNALLYATRTGMKICEAVLDTEYSIGNNSYYQHIMEWIKVYGCVVKFAVSSLLTFLIDFFMLLGLNKLLAGINQVAALVISVGTSRTAGCLANFFINHFIVFDSNEPVSRTMLKFVCLQIVIMALSYLMIHFFNITLGMSIAISKIISDTALFAVSFVIQGKFIYSSEQ